MVDEGVIGPIRRATSNMRPVEAHVAHLRHLGKPKTAELVLHDRHNMSKSLAKATGRTIASHVTQAIEFHSASMTAQPQIRPVLQYYAYLNLAVATILTYDPTNTSYRLHGIQDRTHNLRKLDLSSKVAKFNRKGAVLELNKLLCLQTLKGHVRLKELFVAIPMLSVELADAFQITARTVDVTGGVTTKSEQSNNWISYLSFSALLSGKYPASLSPKALENALPVLTSKYRRVRAKGNTVHYRSVDEWPAAKKDEAEEFYRIHSIQVTNLGGRSSNAITGTSVDYRWQYYPRLPIYPTISAGLILSFVLSSLCRYRAELVDQLAESRLNLLVDVFVNEADAFMIPTFRNLLYRDELLVGPAYFC